MFEQFDGFSFPPGPWRDLFAPPAAANEFFVETVDGVELSLRRVPPDGAVRERPPVMLLHGLAANHRAFHLRERSLANWLATRGFDVWLPELRGHGESAVDGYDWRIDDYLERDLPILLDAIRRETGRETVQWVGHSMGGVLLFCYGILAPDAPIERGLTIGSALDYKVGGSGFERLLQLRPLIERVRAVPYGRLMRVLAPIIGRGTDALHRFNVWPTNIEDEISRYVHARCFDTVPVSLLQSLATTFEPEGLRLSSGFSFVPHADRFEIPVRLVAGSRDAQVAVEAVEHTAELLGGPTETVVHGRGRGDDDHYGHWDLLVGRRAPEETWPEIADWLAG